MIYKVELQFNDDFGWEYLTILVRQNIGTREQLENFVLERYRGWEIYSMEEVLRSDGDILVLEDN
jgi:hypothetical protein